MSGYLIDELYSYCCNLLEKLYTIEKLTENEIKEYLSLLLEIKKNMSMRNDIYTNNNIIKCLEYIQIKFNKKIDNNQKDIEKYIQNSN